MSLTTGILSLGNRVDAKTWQQGCSGLGIGTKPDAIMKSNPTTNELKGLFSSGADWLFLAGHFTNHLYNDGDTVGVYFEVDGVNLRIGSTQTKLKKSDGSFALHKSCTVLTWGGCSVLSGYHVSTMRRLFENPLMLGFAGITGWRIVNALLGGDFIPYKSAFFARIQDPTNLTQVRDAWMNTALFGYAGGTMESLFRAVDPDGQEWIISNKKVARGRAY